MTETEWLECVLPEAMLDHLGTQASTRKTRLFACACVRRVWPLLTDPRLREVVALAERSADERVPAKQMQQARLLVSLLREELEEAETRQPNWMTRAARAAAQAVEALLPANGAILQTPRDIREPPDVISATRIARTAGRAIEAQREQRLGLSPVPADSPRPLEMLDAVELLREIFGNPFRSTTIKPAWLAWNERSIAKMARAIYTECRFDDLPILADALEEAGCMDGVMLAHCRASMAHVRGCWVVDALLGMK
ncbi:MAG TPA: hypothetical protein VN688_01450 [Gemmataceae bacterium]|nr:hypothetical protein [Gemmataceae bacterium]